MLLLSTGILQAAGKDELVYASTKDIRNINPHLYLGEMAAQGMVFEPLVMNTKEGVKPWLAESWEVSPDGRIYTFHLRRDVTFTDGTPFNAGGRKRRRRCRSELESASGERSLYAGIVAREARYFPANENNHTAPATASHLCFYAGRR